MATLKELAREYWANRPMELAAALSSDTLLSLAPLVLLFAMIFKVMPDAPVAWPIDWSGRAGRDTL